MDISAALPTFVITLREGVEAALVVGIVLACLNKAQQSRLNPWVYAGVLAGVGVSILIGAVFSSLLLSLNGSEQAYAPLIKHSLEASFCLIAIALLSWMLVWMTRQSRSLKSEITGTLIAQLEQPKQAGWQVFGLIFVAVVREGFETVVFVLSQFQEGWMPVAGGVVGLISAALIGVMLFQWGVRINLGLFFRVMGVFLLLIVSGLVISLFKQVDAVALLLNQSLGEGSSLCFAGRDGSCVLGPLVWDASQVLPEKQFPGILLKTLLGYRERLYLVPAIAYVIFLTTLATVYFRSLNLPTQPAGLVNRDAKSVS
jgi:high-affinity iron transporter